MRRTPHSETAAETRIHSVEPETEPQIKVRLGFRNKNIVLPSLTTSARFLLQYLNVQTILVHPKIQIGTLNPAKTPNKFPSLKMVKI